VSNVIAVVVVVLLAWAVITAVKRNRRGLVAERGTSIGADLGALSDQPVVRVRALTAAEPGHMLLVLTPQHDAGDGPDAAPSPDLELLVSLQDDDFGFGLLQGWQRSQAPLAIVMPPDSRIVRLRSIDDLQPLTLSRVTKG
jgi:hypothetical protein